MVMTMATAAWCLFVRFLFISFCVLYIPFVHCQTSIPLNVIPDSVIAKFAPYFTFHKYERQFPCSIEFLLSHSTLKSRADSSFAIVHPTQDVFLTYNNQDFYLSVESIAFPGQISNVNGAVQVDAPLYVTVQEFTDGYALTYAVLYAYQGGETLHLDIPLDPLDLVVHNSGQHQGDFEWVTVLIKKDFSSIVAVGFEQHGDLYRYQPNEFEYVDGTHVRARVALNGHANINGFPLRNDNHHICLDDNWCTIPPNGDIVVGAIVNAVTGSDAGVSWKPWQTQAGIVRFGINTNGVPINPSQPWSLFDGRLGDTIENPFVAILTTYFDGTILSATLVNAIIEIAAQLIAPGKIPEDDRAGKGPLGPMDRDFKMWASFNDDWWVPLEFSAHYSGFNNNAYPGVVYFKGTNHIFFKDAGGNGLMHITSSDGTTWAAASQYHIGNYVTSAGPCAVSAPYDSQLHVFYRDGNGNGVLHVTSSDGVNFANANPFYVSLDVDQEPAAAIAGTGSHQGRIVVVGMDAGGNGIMYTVIDNSTIVTHGYSGYTTSAPPSVIWFKDAFHIYFRDRSGNGLMHIQSSDGTSWSQAAVYHPDYTISAGPATTVVHGNPPQLLLFFRDGTGNGLLYLTSTDGQNFIADVGTGWYTGLNIDGRPSATYDPLHNQVIVAGRDHGGNGIMYVIGTH